jgi:hypothetical protein
MKEMWVKRNLPGEVIDITPTVVETSLINNKEVFNRFADRGYEIQQWINNNLEMLSTYCIIDDDNDMLESQQLNFVKTSDNHDHLDSLDIGYGLTKKCSEQVIRILNV